MADYEGTVLESNRFAVVALLVVIVAALALAGYADWASRQHNWLYWERGGRHFRSDMSAGLTEERQSDGWHRYIRPQR